MTVVWKSAVESLDHASKNLSTSQEARIFVEKYMGTIIGILVEQQPAKIGMHERTCVQESLALGVAIVAKDLEIQIERNGECVLLTTLTHVFNKKKAFYKGNKGTWSVSHHLAGMPEVRLRNIERFRAEGGFGLLQRYLVQKISSPVFPKLDQLHQILQAVGDAIPSRTPTAEQGTVVKEMEDDAILVAKAVMQYIESVSDETMKKVSLEHLGTVLQDLQRIFDRLIATRRASTTEFYLFWRSLVLKLITSQSLPLKLYGWEQVGELIEACSDQRPPPRSFLVKNAGCPFANGVYEYAGEVTPDGYSKTGGEVSYVHQIPESTPEVGGKKLTLFRCTMRSQQKWWFLSEADEEQPGTDRDVDYYQHKSKEHEEAFPPASGWITCRNAGVDPPPTLEAKGILVPKGAEFDTLEHQLAKWAIENEIVEQVLGDTTIHREVVSRSTALIKFLASMCSRDQPVEVKPGETEPNQYSLRASHLLFAWKTSTRKADAAVALQVYQLLVSILPLCPSNLAIPLLKAVQTSLHESHEKRDYLFEVSEFCSALASASVVDSKNAVGTSLLEEVREEVLNLLWSVLTHQGAASLKSYDSLKRYVTHELSVEPKGSEHRERFLQSSVEVLSRNAGVREGDTVDETQALRMVRLSHFVLEACPRQQAGTIVARNDGSLPKLLFKELVAYLERRRSNGGTSQFRKASFATQLPPAAGSSVSDSKQHADALNERLRILRYVYGLSDPQAESPQSITMSTAMVESLWKLCDSPEDRESLMVFIASASHSGKPNHYEQFSLANMANTNSAEHLLSSAFTSEVCNSIFLDLFCSNEFRYDELGHSGYRSFQFLFNKLRQSASSPGAKKIALDALWRLCLTAEKDTVASQGMKDLLTVYVQLQSMRARDNGQPGGMEQMLTDDRDESFGERIFQCLTRVKNDLRQRNRASERAAERCLQILNAAIGQNGSEGLITSSTLSRLSGLTSHASLEDTMKCLPHGMRGQACCRRIGIIARRTQMQNQSNEPRNTTPKLPTTMKFTLDVHPLETLALLKRKVSLFCQCSASAVKPLQINGRSIASGPRVANGDTAHMSLNVVPEDSVMDELGVVQGCEFVFVITEQRALQSNSAAAPPARTTSPYPNDLSNFFFNNDRKFADSLFTLLLEILECLPWKGQDCAADETKEPRPVDTHKLVWDFFLALPTNASIADRVKSAQSRTGDEPSVASADDAMEVDSLRESWSQLLDAANFDRSVYILLTIDAYLQPAQEALSILPPDQRQALEEWMADEANSFRRSFIDAGGFGAVVRFFSASGGDEKLRQSKKRRGNAVALRILKSCLFGNTRDASENINTPPDQAGSQLLKSLSNTEGLLKSLTAMVVDDPGISSSTIVDILKFLWLLFRSQRAARSFATLPDAEKFLVILLMWEEGPNGARTSSSISAAMHVRKTTHDLILQTELLADKALPWLMNAIDRADVAWENTAEYFDVLEKLVSDDRSTARSRAASDSELRDLGVIVCRKLASCPRPANEVESLDFSTGVLCGCLKLLRALIEKGGGTVLRQGANILLSELEIDNPWSGAVGSPSNRGVLAIVSSPFTSRPKTEDGALIDIMGVIFDRFLSPGGSSTVAICCDKESRRKGFDVVGAAARSCRGGEGYIALVNRISDLLSTAAPKLCHRWGQFGGNGESHSRGAVSSKYAGLRNQGCTCYMNSFLQQLFMMPEFRESMCSATIPSSLRSSGSAAGNGPRLVGRKIALQWDTGVSYDASVEAFDESTGMHTIRYLPVQVATVGGSVQQQVQPEDIAKLPPSLPEEFVIAEGRPCKETGVFEIVQENTEMETEGAKQVESQAEGTIKETEDESASRHLLEEVQRTFIHLEEGSKGRCFDPRALVEACACLKLEFDVWQQNDASEFATKLLDRLEISLKKWAPDKFKYVDHTFGLQQTTQKICKECGLKTNRQEKLLSIDCQIRGKSDIHEALAAMTEAQIMEGSNKVNCDRCKKKTDTVIRTGISALPNMLILSLKRFDLDFTTFETVKLNNRCAFGQTLDMKAYTLEGIEAMEPSPDEREEGDPTAMDTEESQGTAETDNAQQRLNGDDYQYRLVGVLVHAGVAQGGHYYSFIKDRSTPDATEKWYKFDDDDVTPFDPSLIETECFGGKVKKETKWANGQVHTVEQDQFANALMLFYEKVKPTPQPEEENETKEESAPQPRVATSTGYDVFEPDVLRSNATHRWQSFLFDGEFHSFLKGLLGICCLASSNHEMVSGPLQQDESWREPVMQMLLTFVFDVMLYSSEGSSLNEWARMLEDIMSSDRKTAVSFIHKLASKIPDVSGNWLRTYLLECPDHVARGVSVRIFSAAIKSCAASEEEVRALEAWTQGWREQVAELEGNPADPASGESASMPCALEGKWGALEDEKKIGSGGVSSVGIILSFLNVLLEAMPRCWRFSSELCLFIRNLSIYKREDGTSFLRRAMIVSLLPARLIALAVRERAPSALKAAFPGASVAPEVAHTQVRAESNPSAHVMPLSGNQVMNASDLNAARGPMGSDFILLLESLACLGGLPGTTHASLLRDSDEVLRGRQRFVLSEHAIKALTTIFHESRAPGNPGMSQREIEAHLHRCGIETASGSVPTQKILHMLSKYPTTVSSANGPKSTTYLGLDGFLAYYKDSVQSSDARLRLDLHTFGFRLDLTRRSRESRFTIIGEHEQQRSVPESVAFDVAETFKEKSLDLGPLANMAMESCAHLYNLAYNFSEPLMEYLVAAATYGKKSDPLIDRTLSVIFQTPNDWSGSENVTGCTMILQVIAATPGDDQQSRIARIMTSNSKAHRQDHGVGLLLVLQALYRVRHHQTQQHYNNDVHWTFGRYMNILKELQHLYPIFRWLNANRQAWSFIERELMDSRPVAPHQNQVRGDYGTRDADNALPIDHNTHSDSDMAGMNDSEEDDDDSQFDNYSPSAMNNGPYQIVVHSAGNSAVNGVYNQDGYFETACRYVMDGKWNGQRYKFFIFQCNVSNNTKHWYISIVPYGGSPGTSSDIDFYTAPMTADSQRIPPTSRWIKANEGKDPVPTIEYRHKRQESTDSPERMWSGPVVEDDNEDTDDQGRPF